MKIVLLLRLNILIKTVFRKKLFDLFVDSLIVNNKVMVQFTLIRLINAFTHLK